METASLAPLTGKLLARTHRAAEALILLHSAVAVYETNYNADLQAAELYYTLAFILARSGRIEEAHPHIERCLGIQRSIIPASGNHALAFSLSLLREIE